MKARVKPFRERAKEKMVEAMDDYCSYGERKDGADNEAD